LIRFEDEKTQSDQWEALVGGLTQVGNLTHCHDEVLWVAAAANGIGMRLGRLSE
jgi:hypothetical protein